MGSDTNDPDSLIWQLRVDWSDAVKDVNKFLSSAEKAGKSFKLGNPDTSGIDKAAKAAEAAAAKAAAAAEKAAAREAAAWEKAAQEAIWAAEKQAEREEAAYQKAVLAAERAAARQDAITQKTVNSAIRAAEKKAAAEEAAMQKAAAAASRAAEKQAAAAKRNALAAAAGREALLEMGATGPVERATLAFRAESAEIARLAALTGDQVLADRALAASQAKLALVVSAAAEEQRAASMMTVDLGKGMSAAQTRAGAFADALSSIGTSAMLAAMAVGTVAAAGGAALRSVMDAGGDMEVFSSRLQTMMGSTVEAKARMDELFNFAAKTPFNLQEVVAAEVTMRGFGAATKELLPGLIDFAASTGQDLSQAAVDIGRAWNHGAVGLQSDAAKILRSQIEMKKGMNATKMSLTDFRAALLDTLNEGMFAGGADRLSQTFSGMVSNLEDEWTRFQMEIADAGVFDNVKAALSETLDWISKNRKEAKDLAGQLSSGLWQGFRLAAMGAAEIADAFHTVQIGIDIAETFAGGFALVIVKAAQAADELGGALARAAGQDDGVFVRGAAKLDRMAVSIQEYTVGAINAAKADLQQKTALSTVVEMLDRAEAAAKSYGDALGEASGAGGDAGAGAGAGGKGKKGKEKKDTAFIHEVDAALKFSDELAEISAKGERTKQEHVKETTAEIYALYQERMAQEQAYEDDGILRGKLAADNRLAIQKDYTDKLSAIYQQSYAVLEKQREEDVAREKAAQKAKQDATFASVDALLGASGALIDGMAQDNEEQKARYKEFATTQAVISGIVAEAKALATYGMPAAIPFMIATAVETGVQIAAINKAHQGAYLMRHQGGQVEGRVVTRHQGGPTMYSDELRILRSEIGGILNSQATRQLGEQGVAAINAGRPPVVELRTKIGRLESQEITRLDKLSGGALSTQARANRQATQIDTGFRGRPAP